MLLIINRGKPNGVNLLSKIFNTLNERNIPYKHVQTCDPAIIRRKDVNGLILPGAQYRIHPEEQQDDLELELYYLFHFPKLPVLGICHGCQFLMTFFIAEYLISREIQFNIFTTGPITIVLYKITTIIGH